MNTKIPIILMCIFVLSGCSKDTVTIEQKTKIDITPPQDQYWEPPPLKKLGNGLSNADIIDTIKYNNSVSYDIKKHYLYLQEYTNTLLGNLKVKDSDVVIK